MSTSSGMNKLSADRNQRLLLQLAAKPGNDICADCKARNPRWASFNLGIFICVSCASIHRKIGTHISKVKSLTLDSWSKEQLDRMKEMGNAKSNAIYNPNEIRNPPPPRLDDPARDNDLEQYIRSKYEYRRFLDKKALVASKLGPSRSASSVIPQTNSTPVNLASKSVPTPRTATDIAAAMFSTTKPQLQPRTSPSQPVQPSAKLPPPRSTSQPILPQKDTQTAAKPEGVWADLISLQEPSANASLPLQYQTTLPSHGSVPTGNTMSGNLSNLGSNSFSNVAGGLATTSSLTPIHQQTLGTNPFTQQMPSRTSFTSSMSAPSFQATTSQMSSEFHPSNASLFQAQHQTQPSPVPFYQPQPLQSTLAPSQSHPQFLSSSPISQYTPNPQFLSSTNPQLHSSHSPQILSTIPNSISAQQNPAQNPALQAGLNSSINNAMNMSSYLSPSPQLAMNGVPRAQMPMFGSGHAQPLQATNPFGHMQFGHGGFPGQNGGQWGPL